MHPLAKALGMSNDCYKSLLGHEKEKKELSFPTYFLYKHDARNGSYFTDRSTCVRDYAKKGAKVLYGYRECRWHVIELFVYEKENMRMMKLIEINKKRYRYKK